MGPGSLALCSVRLTAAQPYGSLEALPSSSGHQGGLPGGSAVGADPGWRRRGYLGRVEAGCRECSRERKQQERGLEAAGLAQGGERSWTVRSWWTDGAEELGGR